MCDNYYVGMHLYVSKPQVHSVAWSCDGNRLASGSFDKTVTIWNLESDRLVCDNSYVIKSINDCVVKFNRILCLVISRRNLPIPAHLPYNCKFSSRCRGERETTKSIPAA